MRRILKPKIVYARSIVKLMEAGCKITFPSGYYMQGLPDIKYIQLGHEFGQDGRRNLSLEGVLESLMDEEKYSEEKTKQV